MITLAQDCLLFRLENGEQVPFSAEMISVEVSCDTSSWFDPEVACQAAKAVFHYFKSELGRQSVTAEEFAGAMEKVLKGFKLGATEKNGTANVVESDLCQLAAESANGGELIFFPSLREELRHNLRQKPQVVRFRQLRACVKQMTGARRWSAQCRDLEEQIVLFLRECAGAESGQPAFALLVD